MLTDAERRELLRIARQAVEGRVHGQDRQEPDESVSLPGATGVFVTIKRRGELRGCLGTLEIQRPLAEEVARCAAQSASEDPRFPPVAVTELIEVSLEVSVLGSLEAVDPHDAGAIVIGRHGLVVELGPSRGLLLPQVAIEWNWTTEQFLGHTCRKARLPENAWRRGATVYRFEADVFSE